MPWVRIKMEHRSGTVVAPANSPPSASVLQQVEQCVEAPLFLRHIDLQSDVDSHIVLKKYGRVASLGDCIVTSAANTLLEAVRLNSFAMNCVRCLSSSSAQSVLTSVCSEFIPGKNVSKSGSSGDAGQGKSNSMQADAIDDDDLLASRASFCLPLFLSLDAVPLSPACSIHPDLQTNDSQRHQNTWKVISDAREDLLQFVTSQSRGFANSSSGSGKSKKSDKASTPCATLLFTALRELLAESMWKLNLSEEDRQDEQQEEAGGSAQEGKIRRFAKDSMGSLLDDCTWFSLLSSPNGFLQVSDGFFSLHHHERMLISVIMQHTSFFIEGGGNRGFSSASPSSGFCPSTLSREVPFQSAVFGVGTLLIFHLGHGLVFATGISKGTAQNPSPLRVPTQDLTAHFTYRLRFLSSTSAYPINAAHPGVMHEETNAENSETNHNHQAAATGGADGGRRKNGGGTSSGTGYSELDDPARGKLRAAVGAILGTLCNLVLSAEQQELQWDREYTMCRFVGPGA